MKAKSLQIKSGPKTRIFRPRNRVWVGALVMSLMGLLGFEAFAESSAVHPVTMKSLSYEPKQLTIKAGDSIEWTNKSYTDHSATADDGSAFDTGMVHPGQKSKKIVFKQAGTFEYHCSMHGKTMHGEVTVQP